MTPRSDTPRALLYVATEAGGAACWVDEIRTIEDDSGGGCTIWLHADFADENIAIETPLSTLQVIDALRDIQNRNPNSICVPRANEIKQPDDPMITVTLCDTITNVRVTNDRNSYRFWRDEGTYDAVRALSFRKSFSMDAHEEHKRYLIIATSAGDLAALNQSYPADLLARFDIPTEVQP